ncbi:hypothetical protein [Streptomyces griseocarneus]|uniref:hypothetical protein n=1 Tax=Streptomyces griseocarneus TaxID=51201 RepID=UPI00167EC7BF|nr:hypothetical protein [Streptomyces griseocarneus]MBZ6476478.1 hypothetical protein [Streptomyces griseocarneus]GHG78697.1 hypothetical protein GCM10018779_58740 [Streptomyces griseocarneus]
MADWGYPLMVSYHPAGRDTALYAAVQGVKAGHWMQMRQVPTQAARGGSGSLARRCWA